MHAPAEIAATLQACIRLFQAGRLGELRAACESVLAADPGNADAHHLLGLAAFRERRAADALRHLDAAIAGNPRNPAFHTNRAAVLEAAGRLEDAAAAFARADALAPETPFVLAALGSVLERLGRLEDAASAYRRACAADGSDADVWFNLGNVLRALGKRADALAAFQRAEGENPKHFEAIANAAHVLRELGRAAEAEAAYRRAIAAGPRATAVRVAYAKFLADLGRHAESLEAARAALAGDPRNLHGWIGRAWAEFCLGRLDDALESYSAALDIDPLCRPAHEGLNRILWDRGAFDRFNLSYRRAAADAPENPVALYNLGRALADDNRNLDEAEENLRKAIELKEDYAEAQGALGLVLRRRGNLSGATVCHRRAVALAPGDAALQLDLGLTLLLAGDAKGAAAALGTAVRLAPRNQTALGYWAVALAAADDPHAQTLLDYGRFVGVRTVATPPGYRDLAAFNRAVEDACRAARRSRNAPYDQTLRGGTQTLGHLFRGAGGALADLEAALRAEVAAFAAELPEDASHPFLSRRHADFTFEGCWSVILQDRGFHTNHIHNTWLSGVYYVRVPSVVSEADPDRQGWLRLGVPDVDFPGVAGLPSRDVRPEPGRLVLFPSYVWHGTVPFAAPEERVTVAFDIL